MCLQLDADVLIRDSAFASLNLHCVRLLSIDTAIVHSIFQICQSDESAFPFLADRSVLDSLPTLCDANPGVKPRKLEKNAYHD